MATFTLEHASVLDEIDAAFTFTPPLVLDATGAAATLVVHNRSTETIRFPEPGLHGTHVAIALTSTSQPPVYSFSGFVPQDLLIKASGAPLSPILVDRFTWDAADRLPIRSVAPGGTYRLRLSDSQPSFTCWWASERVHGGTSCPYGSPSPP
jgi:hypothetical protein